MTTQEIRTVIEANTAKTPPTLEHRLAHAMRCGVVEHIELRGLIMSASTREEGVRRTIYLNGCELSEIWINGNWLCVKVVARR